MPAPRYEVITRFLQQFGITDLSNLYNKTLQCHVLVASDGGRREGTVWTDDIETWYPFVVSDFESSNKIVIYNFEKHVEGIGLTGWDWEQKVSRWVAFDFDSIVGHKHGLTDSEIKEILSHIMQVEWVSIHRSTSGRGIHVYVHFDHPIPTENRAEHSAVARAVLHKLSALTGYSFKDKVDICGGNMWIWHKKITKENEGLSRLKNGESLKELPNWKEHVDVIRKVKVKESDIDPLVTAKSNVKLDDEHKKFIQFLQDNNTMWWWDGDKHMLITHTYYLKQAHETLGLQRLFRTNAEGKDLPDQNCFMFPLKNGGWVVRRHTKGCTEDPLWEHDDTGWTKCYFNTPTDLRIAARTYQGVEHPNGAYYFKSADEMCRVSSVLGAHFDLPKTASYCSATIKEHKDGRLIIAIEDKENKIPYTEMSGWIKEGKLWKRIYNKTRFKTSSEDTFQYDNIVRHLVLSSNEDYGWAIKTESGWNFEALQHVRLALESLGIAFAQAKEILGTSVLKCWRIVNRPFAPEYPGDRAWNINSAQIRYEPSIEIPSNLKDDCPHWYKVLRHVSENLDSVIKTNEWAQSNKVYDGVDYLICWVASLFQEPTEPLPYLFLYGPQNSGKSILHEALSLLVTNGYIKVDNALTNKSGFNAEMESAVLCIVEETNLSKSKEAASRIKDWVTAREISIHRKMKTPYMIQNVSHYIQCANEHSACPIFPGDTRIVVLFVDILKELIPKRILIESLRSEAPKFMAYILNYQIPVSPDRLNVPVITTSDKSNIESSNRTLLESFIDDCCFRTDGEMIKFSDFYSRFIDWMGPTTEFWSKQRVGRDLPPQYPKGRLPATGQFYIGNLTFDEKAEPSSKIVLVGDKLVEST